VCVIAGGVVAFSLLSLTLPRTPEIMARNPGSDGHAQRFVVASVPSLNRLASKLKYVVAAGKIDRASGMIDAVLRQLPFVLGSDWLDRDRPAGVVVQTAGGPPEVIAFLPLKSDARIYPGNGLVERSKFGNEIYVHSLLEAPIFLTVRGTWVFASHDPKALRAPLPNVNVLIADTPRDNDLSMSIRLDDLPAVVKEDLLRRLRDIVDEQAAFQSGDRPGNMHSRMLGAQLGTLPYQWLLTDGERVDLGITIAPARGGMLLDLDVVARAGSELAALFNKIQNSRTRLSSLHRSDALVNFSAVWPMIGMHRRLLDQILEGARDSLERAIQHANSTSPSASDTQLAHGMFLPLLDTLETSLAREQLELYLEFREHGSGFMTIDLAFEMKNARELETWLRKNAANLRAIGVLDSVSLDLASEGGTNIHQVWPSFPEDAQEDVDLFGSKKPPLAFGFSHKAFLVSLGTDCVEGVRAMARSLGAVGATAMGGKSLDFELALGRVVGKLVPDVRRSAGHSAEAIFARTMAMDDRMRLEVRHLARGLRVRCALEEGYVRFLGAAVGEGLMKTAPSSGK
jgi:hypothetical protein